MILLFVLLIMIIALMIFDYACYLEDQEKLKKSKSKKESWKPVIRALIQESRKERIRKRNNR